MSNRILLHLYNRDCRARRSRTAVLDALDRLDGLTTVDGVPLVEMHVSHADEWQAGDRRVSWFVLTSSELPVDGPADLPALAAAIAADIRAQVRRLQRAADALEGILES
jgi:hypothetical protein